MYLLSYIFFLGTKGTRVSRTESNLSIFKEEDIQNKDDINVAELNFLLGM